MDNFFDYSIEDDRFIIEYNVGGIYTVVDKLKGEEFIMDNVDADTSLKDLLQMLHDHAQDEEDE